MTQTHPHSDLAVAKVLSFVSHQERYRYGTSSQKCVDKSMETFGLHLYLLPLRKGTYPCCVGKATVWSSSARSTAHPSRRLSRGESYWFLQAFELELFTLVANSTAVLHRNNRRRTTRVILLSCYPPVRTCCFFVPLP